MSRLVTNTNLSLADEYRQPVAFADSPATQRLLVARAAAVLALKGHAFGRTRPDGEPVERDYHDAYLLIEQCGEEIAAEYHATDDGHLRGLVRKAVEDLGAESARRAVRNQITRLEPRVSAREAEARLTRATRVFRRGLG